MIRKLSTILLVAGAISAANATTIGFFGGFGTPENMSHILSGKSQYPFTAKAVMIGVSGQRTLINLMPSIQIRGEAQLIQHFTIQKCQEITIAPLVRVANVFNSKNFPLHVSIGDGLSALIGAEPELENRRRKARRLLNYFLLDLATNVKDKEIFFRWHHRCHVFKQMAPSGTGSNFFLLGVRVQF